MAFSDFSACYKKKNSHAVVSVECLQKSTWQTK